MRQRRLERVALAAVLLAAAALAGAWW